MSIILWVLAIYGLTFIIIDAEITTPVRDWITEKSSFFQQLLKCYFCVGFWISLFFSAPYVYAMNNDFTVGSLMLSGFYVFAGASGAYLLNTVSLYWELHSQLAQNSLDIEEGDDADDDDDDENNDIFRYEHDFNLKF